MKPWAEMTPNEKAILVAEKVMGWTPLSPWVDKDNKWYDCRSWSPSTNFKDMADVLASTPGLIGITRYPSGKVLCHVRLPESEEAAHGLGASIPDAVCLAVLRAHGVTV